MAAKKGTAKKATKSASKGATKSASKGAAKGGAKHASQSASKPASKGAAAGASETEAPGSTGAGKGADETGRPASGAPGSSGRSAPARSDKELSGEALRREMASPTIASVTTMVCLTCGAEQFFDDAVPPSLKCQRCGSMVFRTFDTPTERNEATVAHLEEEARSVQYGDPSPQGTVEDARDLDMGPR
jgi:DNA-directed RNA polymerase subunit RPC12/RpoP